jgi:hypothetical protein
MTDSKTPTDPALDALVWLTDQAGCSVEWNKRWTDKLAANINEIRAALADRISPTEARIQMKWAKQAATTRLTGTFEERFDDAERALIARLGRIAEQDR